MNSTVHTFTNAQILVQVTTLREEVEYHKEMCANYEEQLQQTWPQMTQEMVEKEEAIETMMDTLESTK